MAAKYPTHPGPSGGKRHDEYTLGELLEAMAQRQQGELRDKQGRAEFFKAYESMKATPQEARDAEAAEYEKERVRSIWINAQEKLRQEQAPLIERARRYASPEFGPSSQNPGSGPALREYIKGGQRGPSPGMTIDDYREARQDAIGMLDRDPGNREHWENEVDRITEDLSWLGYEEPAQRTAGAAPPVYSNDDLAAASGGALTPEILDWLGAAEERLREGERMPDREMRTYQRFQFMRDQAKALIDNVSEQGE